MSEAYAFIKRALNEDPSLKEIAQIDGDVTDLLQQLEDEKKELKEKAEKTKEKNETEDTETEESGLNEEKTIYGKYGMLRKQFLKEYRLAKYQYLLLTGKLTEHLNQIDQESREQVEMLMEQMAEKQGVTEELKVQNQTKWVRLMNNIKASAEEMVLREILYI